MKGRILVCAKNFSLDAVSRRTSYRLNYSKGNYLIKEKWIKQLIQSEEVRYRKVIEVTLNLVK